MSCCANRCRLLIEETKELKPTQGASELIEIQIMNNRATYTCQGGILSKVEIIVKLYPHKSKRTNVISEIQ